MNKVWINHSIGDEKVILINESGIYKASPKAKLEDQFIKDITNNNIPKKMFKIPFTLIFEIRMEENSNFINILFSNDSYEYFKIDDQSKKIEIYNYLKGYFPEGESGIIEYTRFQTIKKPLMGLTILTILFVVSLFFAIGFENGETYAIGIRGRIGFLYLLVLAIGQIGIFKIITIYSTCLVLIMYSIIKKLAKLPKVHFTKCK